MLAFVDLIHVLPTRGRKVPNSCIQREFCIKGSFESRGRKIGRNAFVKGELAFMHLGALCRLILVVLFCRWCRALLPHLEESAILEHFISVVSSRCPCLRGPRLGLASDLVFACSLALDHLLGGLCSWLFSFLFLHYGYYGCCQCTHQGGD